MIVKGNARGGGAQLAAHLMNAHDNERVELGETRGSVANDLAGAFAEWRAQSKATSCEKYLYSLSINPDQAQGRMSRADYLDFIARVEKRLGLSDRGRIVVFHEKRDRDGILREHCHAVWSRIDATAGRAVQLSHDRMKLRSVAQEFTRELGRQLPPGMQEDRGPGHHEARQRHSDLHEQQQQERSGIGKEERRGAITKAWQQTTDGKGFAAALQDTGYMLAQGDRRAYVVVDRAGEVHSLSRQIEGAKAKEIAARLEASHPLASLPTVQEAVAATTERREALARLSRPALAGPAPDDRRAILKAAQQARRAQLTAERAAMEQRHTAEHDDLAGAQRLTTMFAQGKGRKRRMAAFVTSTVAKVQQRHQAKTLERRHRAERREMTRKERVLTALDKKEARSLEGKLKRESFQALAQEIARRDARLQMPAGMREQTRSRTPELGTMPQIPAAERQSRLREHFTRPASAAAGPPEKAASARTHDAADQEREAERQRLEERMRRLQDYTPEH